MGFKFIFDRKSRIECDNVLPLWNILKETVDTPYLKSFIVEKYEGGNTLVDIENWKHEEIMYREISPGVFLFPYESIGFVLDDSIDNVTIYVIDSYQDGMDFRSGCLVEIGIRDIETLTVACSGPAACYKLAALYLTTVMKLKYDTLTFNSLESLVAGLIGARSQEMTYLDGTLHFGLKGMDFKVSLAEDGKVQYFKVIYESRWKKQAIKDTEIKNPGYIKKKYLNRKWQFKFLYYAGWILIFAFILVGLPKLFDVKMSHLMKILVPLLIIYIAYKACIGLFRKNYFKIYQTRTK